MKRIALLLVGISLAATACSGDDDAGQTSTAGGTESLTIMADSSLAAAFQELAPDVQLELASSDELRSRIEDGEAADVYAVAGPDFSVGLDQDAVIEPYRVFATNRLVLVVPAENAAGVESLDDLGPDVRVAAAAAETSLGAYTRTALEAVGRDDLLEADGEQDGQAVLDQLAAGQADAGLVFFSDAQAAGDEVEVIELPAQALLQYTIAPVTTSRRVDEAGEFVELVLGDEGRQALENAGFGLP